MARQVLLCSVLALAATACGPSHRPGGDDDNNETPDAGEVCSMDCPTGTVCSMGTCKTPCEASEDSPSNLGCDFLAADLDNEPGTGLSDAASAQYSVVVANNNDYAVNVVVTKNTARVGDPVQEQQVVAMMAAPHAATRIDLPQREVDGTMGQNAAYSQSLPNGTFVAPHAYHIISSGPVVIYQFNPIVQQFSNDASTLIPKQALGSDYIVVGYETANPCSIAGLPVPGGIPDHGAVTIIPYFDDTHVTVTTAHAIKASAGDSGIAIPHVDKGGTLQLTLGRYMTANLESEMAENVSVTGCPAAISAGQDGDFTGTYIKSDKPVAVFTANERGAGFGGAPNVVYPPNWDSSTDDTCCTDHLEEQLFPVTAFGKEFAVARSPIRSTNPSWKEPDIIRVVGTVDHTTVTTNLPAPFNSFTVDARKDVTFAATTGFALSASAPVEIASYLVSQHFVKDGYLGDPSQILIPAAEQHRKDYVFLVPATFTANYAVFARPVGSSIMMDGMNDEIATLSGCTTSPIGMVTGVDYEQVTCPVSEGKHQVASSMPFGLSVYGYYNVGSYAFVGGSDVKIINPVF
ncbi:MAG TPA: IgGFc-binding protein [Kofleriaceae bacterium]|jgi:hypothetical protein